MRGTSHSGPSTLADYVAILRRRAWIIAVPLVLVPTMAVILSVGQDPLYAASTEVYVKRTDIAAASVGVTNPALQQDPVRFLKTQADVARDPKLAQRVVDDVDVPGLTAGRLLATSSVTPHTDADLLDVAVSNRDPRTAILLSNTYAEEFTKYRTELDTARINDAIESVKARLRNLRANGVSIGSAAYGTLLEAQTQLETVGKLLADNTQVLRPAAGAQKVRPRTRRNGILGVLLGGFLGIALGFVAEALDRRVRSQREIEEALGLPLLGRIPKPKRALVKTGDLVMLAQPRSIEAEPIRKLRTNLEFVNLERRARTIMVTSSVQREGKSTTIANLAVAMARSGRRVVLVDLDLRRPYLSRFFRVPAGPGITDVVLGRLELESALRTIPLAKPAPTRSRHVREVTAVPAGSRSSNGAGQLEGMLTLLPAGTIPPDAGELVGTEVLGRTIDALAEQFEFVLIDAPPLLAVGDGMTLSSKVDAMLVLVRLKLVHRGMLHELARLLQACPAEKLGYVLASAELGEGYGYAYAYAYTAAEAERTSGQRVS
jgi:polysaccharide biosynthesis transport protein